jgi:hypothetical protein
MIRQDVLYMTRDVLIKDLLIIANAESLPLGLLQVAVCTAVDATKFFRKGIKHFHH